MRKATIMLAVAVLAMIVDLNGLGLPLVWILGQSQAFGEDPVGVVPKEATGFVGILSGQVAKVGSPPGWDSIKVVQVLGFTAGNQNKLTLDHLNTIKADLLNAVNTLAENTVIMVDFDNGLLRTIKAYKLPKRVEFVRMVTQKVEADTTTMPAVPERVLVGMEVKDSGSSRTIMVDPKDKDARAKAIKVGTFKAGQFLLIRTMEGNDTWLQDARVDPNQDKPKDAKDR